MSRRGAPSVRSVHHQRVLRQLGVAAQCFLDFFLGRGVRLPGVDLALESVGQFPPMLLHMVGSGEASGELDTMLDRVAVYQQAEVNRVVTTLVRLFEPLMLLFMGGMVMFIIMAILLPILNMNQLV